jgi:hypothetical protein
MVYGSIMWITGNQELVWGRALSLLGTLASVLALFFMVKDRTRRYAPSVFAALLFFAYFKPTGFWYDIVRIDMLAMGLGAWGMYFSLKRKVTMWQGVLAVLLLTAATLTKQSMGYVALACGICLLFKNPRSMIISGVAVLIVLANLVLVMNRSGNDAFLKYVVEAPFRHPSVTTIYFPEGKSKEDFFAGIEESDPSAWTIATTYLSLHMQKRGAPLWEDALRHIWVLTLAILLWLLLSLAQWRMPRGWIYLVPTIPLIYTSVVAFGLYGGFLNNFVTMFFAISLMSAFAFDGFTRQLSGLWRIALMSLFVVALVLQLLQPWRLPSKPDDLYAQWNKERDPALREPIMSWIGFQSARQRGVKDANPPPKMGIWAGMLLQMSKFNHSGLTWFPSHQQPHPEAGRAYDSLMAWLQEKHEAGENVAVLHHQWYGTRTGHPLTADVDAIRCAVWTGDPIPKSFSSDLSSGKYKWIVLDAPDPKWDWLPLEIQKIIQASYVKVDPFPPMEGLPFDALEPVTGAQVKPSALFRRR